MTDTLGPILQWLNTHPNLAGFATFVISAAESIAIIGTIVPGTVMMTAIGALAGAGVIPLWPTIFWAILGAIVGDGISYWFGRYFNNRLAYIWPFRSHPGLLLRGEAFFRKHGGMSVFIGRFVGPVRAMVPLVAGMLGMSPLRFTIANVTSAIGWAPAYMLPGILLGAASLELPPDIAVHVLLMAIALLILIMFVIWLVKKILKLIGKQIDQMLTTIWEKLRTSSHFHLITKILKHRNPKKTHGQLTLAFYFIFTCCILLYLSVYILVVSSKDIFINNMLFHLFRSLRTPLLDTIMLTITFLGDKSVLLPVILALFGWLAYKKRWYTALHILALGVITAGGIEILKLLTHSPRPWGLVHNSENFSVPSGHTALIVAFYLGITLLLLKAFRIKSRRTIYYLLGIFIGIVSLSRLYFGVHWFTDILGGWLLGSAVVMLTALSYNRHPEKNLHPTGILLTLFLALLLSYSFSMYRDFDRLKADFVQIDWPVSTVNQPTWWNQLGKKLPLYRINRFGLSGQILNLQWIANLDDIKTILLQNGWEEPAQNDLASILHRVGDVESAEHLPLVPPLYLDKKPALEVTKQLAGNKKLIVLRLWNSNVIIANSKQPLWVGSVEVVPRTYSWLFKHKQNQINLTTELLFSNKLKEYDIKQFTILLNRNGKARTEPMILIKPKKQ
ncbi:MAG: VTT domain-containing protein [Gammaproteobacteria bacterium]